VSADNVPLVRLESVTRRHGSHVVLDRLDLAVPRGERLALIGPSGSGKSTILRLVMMLDRPDEGRLLVDGVDAWHVVRDGRRRPAPEAHVRAVRRRIGMVFQHFHLFPHLSVLRNVTEAPVQVLGLSETEARARATELLGSVGLADKLEARPSQLSGGQAQRVAIARALAMQPEVMLFDEVTSALDPELVGEVLSVLRRLARETDVTMVVVTHQMRFAAEIADRVAFLDHGRVLEQGPPSQVLERPRHERTRTFLKRVLEA